VKNTRSSTLRAGSVLSLNVMTIPTPIAAEPTMVQPIVMTFRPAVLIDPVKVALPARRVIGHGIYGSRDRFQ
jgi:hypothetical protein